VPWRSRPPPADRPLRRCHPAVWPQLEPVELALRQILQEPAKPITSIYFPETGWISMVAYMEDGDAAEVGLIGREGFAGLPILLGGDSDDLEAMVQAPGAALRINAQAFREELDRLPALHTLLSRYALAHHGQVVRTAACTGGTSSTSASPAGC
jgi:CRP-like cAMP-binding protein